MNTIELDYKISSKIVRTWFDTILNPIYEGLVVVKLCLKENDYTWDWGYKDFIEIKKLGDYYDVRANLNFEQLVMTEFPELINLNNEYDLLLVEFKDSCTSLFEKLINSQVLINLNNSLILDYENKGLIDSNNAEYFRNESLEWVAGYLVNNKKQLPFYNIFKNIWNNEYEKYFKILEINEIKPIKETVDFSRTKFENYFNYTLSEIKKKEFELSQKYGEPIVV